ncbi:MAG: hypothetical protein HYY25_04330, partial [Candidatus Wallbacteria bacterium]|nr:hypothetical protein [Candidatus Wallbacteria bacterium]
MRRRIVGLAVGLVFVFALIIDLLHFYRESGHVVRLSTDRLRAIVVTAAAAIDGDAHAELNGCLDRRCPNYEKLSRYLKTVQDANGLATEIYTLQK